MMDIAQEYKRLLALKATPVGVKLCRSEEELSPGRVPSDKLTLCQLVKGAANGGWLLSCPAEMMGCFTAQMILGFREPSERDVKHHARQFTDDMEVARRMVETKPKLPPGKLRGVLVGPLGAFEPDVAVFIVDAFQALGLIEAHSYSCGETLTFLNGVSSAVCSYGVVTAYTTGKPNLSVPCIGAKRYGTFQDNELIFTVPEALLEPMLENALAMERAGQWPIPLVGAFRSPTAGPVVK